MAKEWFDKNVNHGRSGFFAIVLGYSAVTAGMIEVVTHSVDILAKLEAKGYTYANEAVGFAVIAAVAMAVGWRFKHGTSANTRDE